jgi:hypothetical protein
MLEQMLAEQGRREVQNMRDWDGTERLTRITMIHLMAGLNEPDVLQAIVAPSQSSANHGVAGTARFFEGESTDSRRHRQPEHFHWHHEIFHPRRPRFVIVASSA